MAIITGGITGRPAGSVAGIVFGAARGRRGKLVTAREKVIPANPNTPAQQVQRAKFSDCLFITRQIGPSIYQDDWNRAIGQLPGFQSWMSILLNNMDDAGLLAAPPDVPLGDLHFPDTWGVVQGGAAGNLDYTWSGELGSNGTNNDEVVFIAIEAPRPVGRDRDVFVDATGLGRDSLSITNTVQEADVVYITMTYLRGDGAADGLLTLGRSISVTSGA